MIFALLTALAADDLALRQKCSAGDADACDDLAVAIAAELVVAAAEDAPLHRLTELVELLATEPEHWPHLAEPPPERPTCPGDMVCADDTPTEVWPRWTRIEASVRTEGGDLFLLMPDGTAGFRRGPEIVATPRVLVKPDGSTLPVPHALCRAGFTTGETTGIVATAGEDCNQALFIGLDGAIQREHALPDGVERVFSDGETLFAVVARTPEVTEDERFPVTTRTVVDAEGADVVVLGSNDVIEGVEQGRLVVYDPREDQTRWVSTELRHTGRCSWQGRWLCKARGLTWTAELGRLGEPIGLDFPKPMLTVEPELPSGMAMVQVESETPVPILRPRPMVSGDFVQLLPAFLAASEPDGDPVEVPSGRLSIGGFELTLLPGPTVLRAPGVPTVDARLKVVDAQGRAVPGASVWGANGVVEADQWGRVQVPCASGVVAVHEGFRGEAACDAGRIELTTKRPRCRFEDEWRLCDSLREIASDRVLHFEAIDGGRRVVEMVEPRVVTAPRTRGHRVIPRDGRRLEMARLGEELDVQVGPYCGSFVADHEPAEVELQRCHPVEEVLVVDTTGRPLLVPGARPDGRAWVSSEGEESGWGPGLGEGFDVQPGKRVLTELTRPKGRPRIPTTDATSQLVGEWFRRDQPLGIWPDGRVRTTAGEGRIVRSLPGVALVHLEGGQREQDYVLVPLSDGRVLVGTEHEPPTYLWPTPPGARPK